MKGTRKTKHKNYEKARQTRNIIRITLKKTEKKIVKNLDNNHEYDNWKIFNYPSKSIDEMINIDNVIQYK